MKYILGCKYPQDVDSWCKLNDIDRTDVYWSRNVRSCSFDDVTIVGHVDLREVLPTIKPGWEPKYIPLELDRPVKT
jgi:cell wall assembly regulator SMI1